MTHGFAGRTLCIATMHGKERVIAPRLEARLGVRCVLPPDDSFDSDRFGTFSGDVPRNGTPHEVARRKAGAAMDVADTDLAVASEGSFGPHPEVFLAAMGAELVLLVDRARELEILGEDFTTETNFAKRECASLDSAREFADRIGFPEHALVLTAGDPPQRVWRGIGSADDLTRAVGEARAEAERHETPWFISSDMRADRNPTRMRAIDRAATELATRAATPCPGCALPGFGRVDVVRGLPCQFCGAPTRLVRAIVHGCARCSAREEHPRDDGRVDIDPGNCPVCNP